ncbi:DDE-domain-containing protein, partial [Tuber magnatum]
DPNCQAYLGSSTNQELVSVYETISGDGYVLPLMIIVSGAIPQKPWYTSTSIPDIYLIGLSETGYSNNMLSIKWIEHFESFLSLRQQGQYQLLLLDGFDSHCIKEFLGYCNLYKIVVFCLLPHISHLVQPLDVVVFQPYKYYYTEAVESATRTRCTEFDKIEVEFLNTLPSILSFIFKSTTIQSAFKKTGLISYNSEVVFEMLVAVKSANKLCTITLPQLSTDLPTIPQTIQSLKHHADTVLSQLSDLSPSTNASVCMFIRGSFIQAQSGAQVFEDLADTKAVDLTCTTC